MLTEPEVRLIQVRGTAPGMGNTASLYTHTGVDNALFCSFPKNESRFGSPRAFQNITHITHNMEYLGYKGLWETT